MNRYECPYVSDGVEYSAVLWADSEAEAVEKMRLLPWQPGNGPLSRPRGGERQSTVTCALLLLFAVAVASTTALTFKRADIGFKQITAEMHFRHFAYPSGPGKASHRA